MFNECKNAKNAYAEMKCKRDGLLIGPKNPRFIIVIVDFFGHRPRGTSCNAVSPMLSSRPEQRDQTTTPGTTFPTPCEGCVGSLTSPAMI